MASPKGGGGGGGGRGRRRTNQAAAATNARPAQQTRTNLVQRLLGRFRRG